MDRSITKEPFWAMGVEETCATLVTKSSGLTVEEAETRLSFFGPNAIKEKQSFTKIKILADQLKSPLIVILIVAGLVTFFLQEWVETIVIFAAVVVNTVLGFYQEYKAETALALLRSYIKTRTRVRRSNKEYEADAKDLVPGDIVHLSQGDLIPADARLLFVNNLEVDEAVLTGESLPVEKDISPLPVWTTLANRKSMVFGGTLVVRGLADAVVTATGNDTEFGKIASLVAVEEREPTPLQRSVLRFAKLSGFFLMLLVGGLFIFGLYLGKGALEMFLIAVAVAVSAVPEGLPIAFTVVLAVGVQRLVSRKAVVRKLLAAETLGSTTLILTDKTGTLTQAAMHLTAAIPYTKEHGGGNESDLLGDAILNADVVIENPGDPPIHWRIYGQALEVALVQGAALRGVFLPRLLEEKKVIDRLPFSPEHKFSASVSERGGEAHLVLFGAPEVIIEHTTMPQDEKEKIREDINTRASTGEKILGVASRVIKKESRDILDYLTFGSLLFRGFLIFRDPVRPHVAEAIHRIGAAGVKTIIVTGDHRGTAESVARELGLIDGGGAVLEGDDMLHLSHEELSARAPHISIYARVTPEQKVTLVNIYKEKGEIVAMTGDGVNDAPALNAADIGVAVGSGTDVAKGAADIVILDNNFETLVLAIEEGRRIYDNIRKVIVYLLSDSLDELLLIGGALLFSLPLPINALQILFVNFFSDSFPAIALAFERDVDNVGSRPHKLNRNLFDSEMRFLILVIGILLSALPLGVYIALLWLGFDEHQVRTFIFASFSASTLFLVFSVRSLRKSLFRYNPFSNIYLVYGVLAGLILTFLVVYTPSLQRIFDTVSLPPLWLLGVGVVGLVNILAVEFGKWIFYKPR